MYYTDTYTICAYIYMKYTYSITLYLVFSKIETNLSPGTAIPNSWHQEHCSQLQPNIQHQQMKPTSGWLKSNIIIGRKVKKTTLGWQLQNFFNTKGKKKSNLSLTKSNCCTGKIHHLENKKNSIAQYCLLLPFPTSF